MVIFPVRYSSPACRVPLDGRVFHLARLFLSLPVLWRSANAEVSVHFLRGSRCFFTRPGRAVFGAIFEETVDRERLHCSFLRGPAQ